MLTGLSLRSRLLLAAAFTMLVQGIAAFVLTSYIADQLLDQIDERLEAAAEVAADGDFSAIGDVYQGLAVSNEASTASEVMTLNALVNRGSTLPPPAVSVDDLASAREGPVTVDAVTGKIDYRMVGRETADGDMLLLASPLTGYRFTLARLTRVVVLVSVAVALTLAVVTWWMLRVGINPIKRMTSAADEIASGDLARRVETPNPHTEAGQLGLALNTMLGHIEASFERQSQAEERLREFIADASHELRTPVATIRGYGELYEKGGLDDRSELDDAMGRMTEESRRLSRLINDMLQLAKLDRGPEVRTEQVDLGLVARETVMDAMLTSPGHVIELDIAVGTAVVFGDDHLLRQAAANLVGNAMIHTYPASTITVSVRVEDGIATLAVGDNGDGMSPDVVDRVTERFYRADVSRDRQSGGSGLGLAIVASIAAAHGAELMIASAVDEGTTVSINMPIIGARSTLG